MYNMNTSSLLGVAAESGPTPRTPEIVNSLISMTNPFDRLRSPTTGATAGSPTTCHHPSSPGPSESASSAGSPPSVQHTCSQLIKEGLKLTLQTKRKNNGDMSPQQTVRRTGRSSPESQHCDTSNDGLTPEDEERRRRRRERNKIAATKCRLKKRERTVNLVYESEILETQNHDLKSKIQELETQRRRLVDVLSVHRPTCSKQPFPGSSNSFQDLPRSSHQLMEAHSAYSSYSATSYSHHQEVYTSQDWASSYPPMGGYNRPMGEPVYTNLSSEVRSFSGGLSRPSNLLINTSSSDYESNTEVVDSPSTHHHPSYPFDEEGGFNPAFPTTSCIT